METVTVNAKALREILAALNGPGHLIRELQVTRDSNVPGVKGISELTGVRNPIDQITDEFNAQVVAFNEGKIKTSMTLEQAHEHLNRPGAIINHPNLGDGNVCVDEFENTKFITAEGSFTREDLEAFIVVLDHHKVE